eukprot:GHVS01087396.1.p1 GENE.GHVS01087396.1~~GHVS01087396.1.p1  ORF type:complete len:172 (+),score=32.85 GHVS01087396.1:25-540(+)
MHMYMCSRVRDVPDHQEAYADESGDLSLIIEIDQLQASVDNQNIGRHFWTDLANANNSTSTTVIYECSAIRLPEAIQVPLTGLFADAVVVVGQQTVSKFNKDTTEAKPVNICIAVYRVADHNADILLTLQRACTSPDVEGELNNQQQLEQLVKCFIATASSLVIKNYSLFT